MIAIGYVLIVVAVGWLMYKLYLSFSSAGGTDFMLPVYDAAMYPPILGVIGLFLVQRSYEATWSFWVYAGIWLAATLLAVGAIKLMEEIGDRML